MTYNTDQLQTNNWKLKVGLEVHVQLNCKTKLFSSAPAIFDNVKPNHYIQLMDIGALGIMPQLNSAAVIKALQTCLALNLKINQSSSFDRKHYRYPDSPCNYQITQHFMPIGVDGYIHTWINNIKNTVRIQRAHLECDAGKSIHTKSYSQIDYNRSGIALLEIVTYPELSSADEVVAFLKTLRTTLKAINTSDANMELGQLRADVNISVYKDTLQGARVEIKNLNSLNSIKKAIEYEKDRHIAILEQQNTVLSETRLFNVSTNRTSSMRSKETAADYCYMPEPDLPTLNITAKNIEEYKIPSNQIPSNICEYWQKQYGIEPNEAWIMIEVPEVRQLFIDTIDQISLENRSAYVNFLIGEVLAYINTHSCLPVRSASLLELMNCLFSQQISLRQAKEVFSAMCASGQSAKEVIKEKGMLQINNPETVKTIVDEVVITCPDEVKAYLNAQSDALRKNLVRFLMGQCMKISSGQANPKLVSQYLSLKLKQISDEHKSG